MVPLPLCTVGCRQERLLSVTSLSNLAVARLKQCTCTTSLQNITDVQAVPSSQAPSDSHMLHLRQGVRYQVHLNSRTAVHEEMGPGERTSSQGVEKTTTRQTSGEDDQR